MYTYDWNLVAGKDPRIKTYQCDGQDNFKGFKAVGELPFSVQEVMCYLSNIDYALDYNVPLESVAVVKTVNARRYFARVGVKGVIVVSARDFVIYSETANYDPIPKEQTIITFSANHPDAPTPEDNPKVVRGTMMVGGWHLERTGAKTCRGTYLSVSDIKGSIPKFVLTMGVGQITQSVVKLIQNMEKLQEEDNLDGDDLYVEHMAKVAKDEAVFKFSDLIPPKPTEYEDDQEQSEENEGGSDGSAQEFKGGEWEDDILDEGFEGGEAEAEVDFEQLDEQLKGHQFIGGDNPTLQDRDIYENLDGKAPPSNLSHLWSWYLMVSMFPEDVKSTWKPSKTEKKKKKKETKPEQAVEPKRALPETPEVVEPVNEKVEQLVEEQISEIVQAVEESAPIAEPKPDEELPL